MDRREFLKFSGMLPLVKRMGGNGSLIGDEANVIVIVLDAFSGLHLPDNGYPRNTTPNLTRLAERATVYHNHYAGGNYTTPGTATLLTGAYPWSHRAMHAHDPVVAAYENANLFSLFDGHHRMAYTHNGVADVFLQQFNDAIEAYLDHLSLYLNSDLWLQNLLPGDYDIASLSWGQGGLFQGRGYANSLFWAQLFSQQEGRQVERVRESYGESFPLCLPATDAEHFFILEHAIDWINTEIASAPQPFMGYYHLLPPHSPYCPRQDYFGVFEGDGFELIEKPRGIFSEEHTWRYLVEQRRYYDEFILYTDSEMGRLIDLMDSEGLMENTWLVITSDHGQMFDRGCNGHGGPTMYEDLTRIPLFVHAPGQEARRDVYEPTSATDVLPSLLRAFGKDVPDLVSGEEIFNETREGRSVYCMNGAARFSNQKYRMSKGSVGMVKGRYKLITYFGYAELDGGEMFELYDLEADPEELVNLYEVENQVAREMSEELRERLEAEESGYW